MGSSCGQPPFSPNVPDIFADRMMTVCHISVPYPHLAFNMEVKANQKTKVQKQRKHQMS